MGRKYLAVETALFLGSFLFLLTAVNPSFYMDDSPEILTAAKFLAPAHPPGYPLYIVLAHLTGALSPTSFNFGVNLFSAVLAALSAVLLFRLMVDRFHLKAHEALFLSGFWILGHSSYTAALSAKGGIYHLSVVLWLAQWLALSAGQITVAAFFLGLSLAHHWMTAVPFALGLWWLLLRTRKFSTTFLGRRSALALCLGLSPYFLLPLMAHRHPMINYGDPSRFGDFLNHVFLRQFWGSGGALSIRVFPAQALAFTSALARDYPLPTAFGLVGVVIRARDNRPAALRWIAVWLWTALAVNLFFHAGGPRFDLYYRTQLFPTHLFLFVFAAWGWRGLFPETGLVGTRETARRALLTVSMGLLILQGVTRWRLDRQAEYTVNYDYGVNALRVLPRGSLLLTKGDGVDFPLWYLQASGGIRPDVVAVSVNSLPQAWFREDLSRRHQDFSVPVPVVPATDPDPKLYVRTLVIANRPRPAFASYNQLDEDRLGDSRLLPWGPLQRLLLPEDPPLNDSPDLDGLWRGLRFRKNGTAGLDPVTRDYQWADYGVARNRLGLFWFEKGKSASGAPDSLKSFPHLQGIPARWMEESLWHFNEATRLDPGAKDYPRNAGLACFWMGRPQEAWDWYGKSLAVDPTDIQTLTLKSLVALEVGRNAEADSIYQRILELEPGNPTALQGREWLQGLKK